MCVGMVIFMTTYNLVINDMIGTVSLQAICMQFILGFIIAFLLELFIVGPVARKIAFSLPYDKSKRIFVILSLAFFMVSGMVLSMSLYGLGTAYFANSLVGESLFESYVSIVSKNFIFALPLQLIVVGPLVRYVFSKIVVGNRV
jgi:hypothetical protein